MSQGPETSASSITLTARPRVFCRVVGETRGTTHARQKKVETQEKCDEEAVGTYTTLVLNFG